MPAVNAPITINKTVVKNRLTMAPTVKFNWADDRGLVHDGRVRHYEVRAEYGCGLICVEATCVSPDGRLHPTQIGLWEDGQIEGHKKIVDACKAYGAVMLVQLHHAGGVTHPETGPQKGPSAVQMRGREVQALTVEEIKAIEQQFVDAAIRAKKAGYDGVQLHGCHFYLIDQFVDPTTNKRTDAYGGSVENRTRFGCEIIRGIRQACGEDFIISVRVSGCTPTIPDAVEAAEAYVAASCDYLQVSNGVTPFDKTGYEDNMPYNEVAYLGVKMHEHFKGRVPVSCVNGLLTVERIRYMLDNDLTDTVDLARGLLADPRLCAAVLDGIDYIPCRDCKSCQWRTCPDEVKCPGYLRRVKTAECLPQKPDYTVV